MCVHAGFGALSVQLLQHVLPAGCQSWECQNVWALSALGLVAAAAWAWVSVRVGWMHGTMSDAAATKQRHVEAAATLPEHRRMIVKSTTGRVPGLLSVSHDKT